MDFNVGNVAAFNIGGLEVWFTETMVNLLIISAILIIFAVIVRSKLNSFSAVPTGIQNVAEFMIETFDKFVRGTAGNPLHFLGPWFFTVFSVIALSNVGGMFFRPPTADWAFTLPMAVATFVLIQAMGIKFDKKYFRQFINPLNIIGEFARPVALSFRLFGNLLAGMILVTLFYEMTPIFVRLFFPIILHGFFDTAMGVLQAYVFTVLSLAFIGGMAGTSEG